MLKWPRERFTREGKLKAIGERKCEHDENEKAGEDCYFSHDSNSSLNFSWVHNCPFEEYIGRKVDVVCIDWNAYILAGASVVILDHEVEAIC